MIKRSHVSLGAALAAVVALGGCGKGGGANVAMEPGEWETTVQVTNVSLENLPPEMRNQMGSMPTNQPQTTRGCMIATADVVRIENLRFTIPEPSMHGAGCTLAELVMEGGQLRGRLSCNGLPGPPSGGTAQTMNLSGELNGTYTPNSAQATAHGEVHFGDRSGSGDMRITSRRIGACPPPQVYTPPPMETMNLPLEEMNTIDMMPPVDNVTTNAM
jgi:hypothetical protein